jgi:carboxyl-terminal processing protease
MSRWNLAWLLAIPTVALLGLALSHSAPVRSKDKDYELVRLLVDVLDEVDKNYIRELDNDGKRKLIEDMINGGLDHLDPHSSFMNPKEYKLFTTQSRGRFGGVGIQIHSDPQTGRLTVVSPIVGTPAYEAGVLSGDIIAKINGKTTDGMRLSEAVDLIQGEPGTAITLSVRREGAEKELDLEMKRAEIEMPSVLGDSRKVDEPKEWEWFIDKESKIACIRVVSFSEKTADDLKKVLEQLKKEGVHGLVLDLRNNPGGLLSGAVEVSNLFIADGRIVSTRGRNQKERPYDAKAGKVVLADAKDCPMVVLINKYSASASEIVAAALQDHGRAVVIGERSFGKGSVQNILKLENDHSALKLTTASYWRPSGRNIHRFPDAKDTDEWGVKPNENFEVKLNGEDFRDYLEYRRERDIVHGKPGSPPAAPAKPKLDKDGKPKPPFVDRVLEKALEHLRGEIKKAVGA